MTAENGWPDAERPGVPLNPERDGAHWIIGWNNSPFVAEWEADPNAEFGGDWGWYDGGDRPDGVAANGWTYGGPCLTPSEIAAREAAAWCAGRDAMRSEAAIEVECRIMCDACAAAGRGCKIAQRVCALNLTPPADMPEANRTVFAKAYSGATNDNREGHRHD